MAINLTDRAVVKAMKTEIDLGKHTGRTLSAERRQRMQLILEDVASTSEDDRARLNAAKELLRLDWEVYQHENPAVQKSEINLKIEKIEVELVSNESKNTASQEA